MGDCGSPGLKRRIGSATGVVLLILLPQIARASHEPPVITGPISGQAIGATAVTIDGTAAGDAVAVSVYEGAALLATTVVSGGRWSGSVSLPDGSHTVTARARDQANVLSAPSAPVTFTVDTAQPAVPVITAPEAGSTLTDSNITVEGIAEPLARVEVTVSTGGTFSATADTSGAWRATRTFTSTSHTLRATAIDAAGNRSGQGPAHTFTVDLIDPTAPVLYGPAQDEMFNVPNVRVFGSAEAGSTVTVYEGSALGSVTTASDGTWSMTLAFSEAAHSIQARARDAAGRTGQLSAYRRFRVDLTAPAAPVITSPAEGSFVTPDVTVSGMAEPGAQVDLLRSTGSSSFGHGTAGADGRWSIAVTLPHGERTISARARDRAGNLGPTAPVRTFTVDADTPVVSFETEEGTIFWPSDTSRLAGTAQDSIGVKAIELQFYDLLGRALPYQVAVCADCPEGTDVRWFNNYAPPRGRYVVKAYAIDRVKHRSEAAVITIVRL